MFLKQYYLQCLSQASYMIADESTKRAVVIDPQRDIEQYVADAAANGFTIERVIETHFHADFLSGHLELAKATGATVCYGEGARGLTGFPTEFLADGQRLSLGTVELEARSTPGHTPESTSIVAYESASAAPAAVFTGDTLFIGDVGRPDLLSSVGHSADGLARQLFHSLHQKLLTLPDSTLVYPAHGAGSACGKNLSTETVSTIGDQRATNYALAPMSEDEFVEVVTQGQSVAPMYFLYAATTNRSAHGLLDETVPTAKLSWDEVQQARLDGAALIDTRDPEEFALGHIKGAINIGFGGRLAEYAGQVIEPGKPIVLVCADGTQDETRIRMARIGFDNIVGYLDDPIAAMIQHPDDTEQSSRLTAASLDERMQEVNSLQVVDIRGPGETQLGLIPSAKTIELSALTRSLEQLDANSPTVVYCAGGYRSSIAASVLRNNGFSDVSDLVGGYGAWQLHRSARNSSTY
jgi:hydroxyacylglutathione hydrolase